MGKLGDLSKGELREALRKATGKKPTQRLMIALAYSDDVPVSTLSDRYGIPVSTLYYWLNRFEERSLEEAIFDDQRPGRPRKLSRNDSRSLRHDLSEPPTVQGFEEATWTPELLRDHIERRYGESYSLGHLRRIIREETDPSTRNHDNDSESYRHRLPSHRRE